MNVAFIGGGSLRILPIVRAWLGQHTFLRQGSIRLIDRCLERAEAVGRLIQRCPEFRDSACSIVWIDDLEQGLSGVDVLYVTMEIARNPESTAAYRLSNEYGYMCSDQLSVHGAFLALQGGGSILHFARVLERVSPHALMLIFANPVSVYSTLVNQYTRIRALGICEGFDNHKWDIPRLLGYDRHEASVEVVAAGVNHLSFILSGTIAGEELNEVLKRKLHDSAWHPAEIHGAPDAVCRINRALRMMQQWYVRFGYMIFSSESDGMGHLDWEEVSRWPGIIPPDRPELSLTEFTQLHRTEMEDKFSRFAAESVRNDDSIWQAPYPENAWFGMNEFDISNPILGALAGEKPFRITASAPNRGAVAGFREGDALEYTMELFRDETRILPGQFVPPPFHGLISALAEFQTLQADAIGQQNPKLFRAALEAYPMWRGEKRRGTYFREIARIYSNLPPPFQNIERYLP